MKSHPDSVPGASAATPLAEQVRPLGVGMIGAGPVVQAIHLPTLARLADLFTVRAVMDVNATVADEVASRAGAVGMTDLDAMLADESVEVVAICSPPQFHAEQAIAALRAGKRAVLVEKPLGVTRDEAEAITAAARETGVPLFVGAMHAYDPAWLEAQPFIRDLQRDAHSVRSSIVLPPNDQFEDWSTEIVERPVMPAFGDFTPEIRAAMMPPSILGLAIHDLPLVRTFLPQAEVLVSTAEYLPPFGYAITARAGATVIDITGFLHQHWKPMWELEAVSADASLRIEFTPSFVHAGSATAVYTDASGTRRFGLADHNGYEGEWRALAQAAHGDRSLTPDPTSLVADLVFALDIAETAAALQLNGADA